MSALRIAAAQYAPVVGDVEGNCRLAVEWTRKAADAGAQLVVLPELASSGYAFASEDEAALAERFESSHFVSELTQLARERNLHVVSGINEQGDTCRYNAAVVIGPGGVAGRYRKVHLFYNEKNWFEPGDALTVVSTPWGRLGVLICYDLWFPEVARAMALAGADVIAVPTNWVSNFKSTVYDDRGWCKANYVAVATAAQNGVVVACADRIGSERDVNFLGASVIVGADGWPLAGPASADADELLIADVDLDAIAAARRFSPRNELFEDRRPETYNVATAEPPVRARSQ